jgi:hypothetical protein
VTAVSCSRRFSAELGHLALHGRLVGVDALLHLRDARMPERTRASRASANGLMT